MKKSIFFAAVAAVAMAATSCNGGYKANLSTDIDTLSYEIGVMNGSQLVQYVQMQGVDSTEIGDLRDGIRDGLKMAGDKKKEAYFLGMQMGMQTSKGVNQSIFNGDSIYKLSDKNFLAGVKDGIDKNFKVFNPEKDAQSVDPLVSRVRNRILSERYGEVKAASEKFMADNAKKSGVKKLPSGVQYKVIKEGEGKLPTDTTTITLHYEGKFTDGKVFDSSKKNGQPVTITLKNQFIPGFMDALRNMPEGSTWEVYLPYDKAYGENGTPDGKIKPYSALIFTIEVLKFGK